MIDQLDQTQRQFATELLRTVLRRNPHLLAVNHFLICKEWLGDKDIGSPLVRLSYCGMKSKNQTAVAIIKEKSSRD